MPYRAYYGEIGGVCEGNGERWVNDDNGPGRSPWVLPRRLDQPSVTTARVRSLLDQLDMEEYVEFVQRRT